jgi:hypothetical protein
MRSQTKVVLRCTGEEELLVLEARAQSLKLCARSIQDASVCVWLPFSLAHFFLVEGHRSRLVRGRFLAYWDLRGWLIKLLAS